MKIFTFALLTGVSLSQTVEVSIDSLSAIEYSKNASISCKWDYSKVSVDIIPDPENDVDITWRFNDKAIYAIPSAESYDSLPMFETIGAGNDVVASVDLTEKTSVLKITNTQLAYAGLYKCDVKFAKASNVCTADKTTCVKGYISGSAKQEVSVFAKPSLSLNAITTSIDIRNVNNSRIASVGCSLDGAFPQPETLSLMLGDREIFADSIVTEEGEDGLFSASFQFEAQVDGTDDGAGIVCKAGNALWGEDARSVEDATMEVFYNPTKVDVQIIRNEQSVDGLFEGEEARISCVANGNPAPTLNLVSLAVEAAALLESDSENEATDAPALITPVSFLDIVASRTGQHNYKCEANSDNGFSLESDSKAVEIYFLDEPTISVQDDTPADQTYYKPGDAVTLSCDVNSYPKASYSWSFNGESMDGASGETFAVDSLTPAHKGKYACTVALGDQTKTSPAVDLNIMSSCEISEISTSTKIIKGGVSVVTFTCNVEYEDANCKYRWDFDAGVYGTPSSGIYKKYLKFGEYSPDLEQVNDRKLITCRAYNAISEDALQVQKQELRNLASTADEGMSSLTKGILAFVLLCIAVCIYKECFKKSKKPEEEQDGHHLKGTETA